jgi:hypothetical protein
MVFCTFAYGLILLVRFNIKTEEEKKLSYSRQGILLLIFCGIFLGFGTLSRWIAIDLAPIAVRLWLGAGLVVIGASLITFSR